MSLLHFSFWGLSAWRAPWRGHWFRSDDDGVLFRMVHDSLNALDQDKSTTTATSFEVLNKYAWFNNLIQLFKEGKRVGIMAKPQAGQHVICQYPCDGDTNGRNYNCPVHGCPCEASGKEDWCDYSFRGLGPHKPCAFKTSERTKMMRAFRDVQLNKSPLQTDKAGRAQYGRPSEYGKAGRGTTNTPEIEFGKTKILFWGVF